jgi:CheY-like chemotaxis protein
MDDQTLIKIFEPFFTTKAVDKGTGLGLSQVYGFAKQSGGDVSAKSKLGHGTAFTLYRPRTDASPVVDAVDRQSLGDPLPSRRVLLVEDNEAVGKFAAGMLRELGQTVTWVGDGKSAIEALRKNRDAFDLVFSDVVMPGISGIELGHAIRVEWPDLEVVLTSGYSHVLVDEGPNGFRLLRKPYSVDGLARILGDMSVSC